MRFKCDWCDVENKIKGMASSIKMSIICSECGTKLGFIDYRDLNELIRDRNYWKKKYFELTWSSF